MKTTILVRARQHFNCAIRDINRHNQRSWVRSLRFLGDKWLLAMPVSRLS